MRFSTAIVALAGSATSTILWDGRFNDLTSSTDLNNWSWSDEVGPYQYYIVSIKPLYFFPTTDPSSTDPRMSRHMSTYPHRTRTQQTQVATKERRSHLTAPHTGMAKRCEEPN